MTQRNGTNTYAEASEPADNIIRIPIERHDIIGMIEVDPNAYHGMTVRAAGLAQIAAYLDEHPSDTMTVAFAAPNGVQPFSITVTQEIAPPTTS